RGALTALLSRADRRRGRPGGGGGPRRRRTVPAHPDGERLLGPAMLGAIVRSMRPRQWVKNSFVFGGVVFSERLFTPAARMAAAGFVIFCALSGAIYLFNDVADRDKDRRHPDKRHRPIAAGRLSVGAALVAAVVLVVGGLAAAIWLSRPFALAALAYVVLLA